MYERAVCLVIDMPARTGFDTLRLLRGYGVNTPALLVVDGGPASRFDESAWALNVVPRTADPRDVMHWIESMCITRQLLEPVRQDEGRANRLSIA